MKQTYLVRSNLTPDRLYTAILDLEKQGYDLFQVLLHSAKKVPSVTAGSTSKCKITRYSYTAIFKLKTDTTEAKLNTLEKEANTDKEWHEKVRDTEKTFDDALKAAFKKRSQREDVAKTHIKYNMYEDAWKIQKWLKENWPDYVIMINSDHISVANRKAEKAGEAIQAISDKLKEEVQIEVNGKGLMDAIKEQLGLYL